MPTVLRVQGYQFYFYANEGSEPSHLHVDKGGATAKYWLSPIRQVYARGFSPAQQRTIETILQQHQTELIAKWNEKFPRT